MTEVDYSIITVLVYLIPDNSLASLFAGDRHEWRRNSEADGLLAMRWTYY